MNWYFSPCRHYRQEICLLDSGVLSGPERNGVEKHLADCTDCRKFHAEIKPLATRLAAWEKNFANLEPGADAKARWAKEIRELDKRRSTQPLSRNSIVWNIWHELFWPSRHIWAGLAAVWVFILAANISMQDHSQTTMAKSSAVPEIIMTWQQQQRLLVELMGANEMRAALPPKPFTPQPRSEQRFEMMTASIGGDDVRSL